MEHIRNHDRYLDPPDEPRYAACASCGWRTDTGDMTKINGDWICNDCVKIDEELEEDDYDNV